MSEDEAIASQLEALLTPAITSQENYYRQLGMRQRILTLPLMVAAVLTLLWRDVAGVTELTRMLAREGFLWCDRLKVSQQALSQRFLTFPASLFEGVFQEILPQLIEKESHFITRLKKRAAIQVEQVFTDSYGIRDRKIRLGSGTEKTQKCFSTFN